ALALAGYAVGLTGYAAIKVLSPAFYALNDAKTPMIIALCSIAVNALASYGFRQVLDNYGYGHIGVALATSSVALVNFFALALMMRKRISRIDGGEIIASFIKIAVASAIMSAVCWFSYYFLANQFGAKTLFAKFVEALVPITLGGITFLLMAKVLRVEEVNKLYNALSRKLGKKG
ncbi:MAG: polysaccharide biosynthesis C-terminal domain-containing protein, partial [Acidobacteriota bacterium]|nr:polysaccharide biosynthesis C-terminal domain-containing protein [Acidobacteriota bacterium]